MRLVQRRQGLQRPAPPRSRRVAEARPGRPASARPLHPRTGPVRRDGAVHRGDAEEARIAFFALFFASDPTRSGRWLSIGPPDRSPPPARPPRVAFPVRLSARLSPPDSLPRRYDLELWTVPGPVRPGLAAAVEQHPEIKAVFMGTRRSDPHAASLQPFQVSARL